MKAKYLLIGVVVATMTACNLDVFPTGSLTAGEMAKNEAAPEYATAATYALLKDGDAYAKGTDAGNTYIRHYFQMAEFPADNCNLSGRTEDVLYFATCYNNYTTQSNVQAFWYFSYHIISSANGVINTVKDGASAATDQIKGENYFLRALAELNLVTMYAKPYTVDRTAPGIVLVTGDSDDSKRATVEESYNQIVSDLQNAIRLMNKKRGNNGYASKEAAQGLLTRVYLYMGKYAECVQLANEILGGDPSSKLEQGAAYAAEDGKSGMFANAKDSKEVLFCVALMDDESKGQEMMGSMFIKDGVGWGEIYPSDPLLNLYERYPQDIRMRYILPQYKNNGKEMVSFPVKGADGDDYRLTFATEAITKVGEEYSFSYDGTKYTTTTETINGEGKSDPEGEYTQRYITIDGEKQVVRITPSLENRSGYTSLKYFMSKFSYQGGDPMLNSPIFIRWAEVILNRAEANAHLNNDAAALADVNIIRRRAGLTDETTDLFATDNMHGYESALNIVLDERRLELAFEGFRTFDVYRNKLDMDRRFAGIHPWEVVKYTDPRTQYPIPYNEITANPGVTQNPGY